MPQGNTDNDSPPIGYDHPTVVPENYDPDNGDDRDEVHFIVTGENLDHITGNVERMVAEKIGDILREDYGIPFDTIEVSKNDP